MPTLTNPALLAASADALIEILLRTQPGLDKRLSAFQRRLDSVALACALVSVGFGLHDLLVEIGSIDFGKHLPGFDRRADVGLPFLDVAADAGKQLRLRIGLQPPGKFDAVSAAAAFPVSAHSDDRHRLIFGPFA